MALAGTSNDPHCRLVSNVLLVLAIYSHVLLVQIVYSDGAIVAGWRRFRFLPVIVY